MNCLDLDMKEIKPKIKGIEQRCHTEFIAGLEEEISLGLMWTIHSIDFEMIGRRDLLDLWAWNFRDLENDER